MRGSTAAASMIAVVVNGWPRSRSRPPSRCDGLVITSDVLVDPWADLGRAPVAEGLGKAAGFDPRVEDLEQGADLHRWPSPCLVPQWAWWWQRHRRSPPLRVLGAGTGRCCVDVRPTGPPRWATSGRDVSTRTSPGSPAWLRRRRRHDEVGQGRCRRSRERSWLTGADAHEGTRWPSSHRTCRPTRRGRSADRVSAC